MSHPYTENRTPNRYDARVRLLGVLELVNKPDREEIGMAAYYSQNGYSIISDAPAIMLEQYSQRAASNYNVRLVGPFDNPSGVGGWVANQEWDCLESEGHRLLGRWHLNK